jgi:hypothetical protein
VNLYAYAGNNPVSFSDPFGLCHELQRGNCTQGDIGPEKAVARGNDVVIVRGNGTEEIRSGGSRSWRNNNPGNVEEGPFTRSQGSIGVAARFAVFPSEKAGTNATTQLLNRDDYQAKTLDGATAAWAPPIENNTANYQSFVSKKTGIDGGTAMNTLTQDQIQSVTAAIRAFEGWSPGTVTYRRP